jgi:hypothetical protein
MLLAKNIKRALRTDFKVQPAEGTEECSWWKPLIIGGLAAGIANTLPVKPGKGAHSMPSMQRETPSLALPAPEATPSHPPLYRSRPDHQLALPSPPPQHLLPSPPSDLKDFHHAGPGPTIRKLKSGLLKHKSYIKAAVLEMNRPDNPAGLSSADSDNVAIDKINSYMAVYSGNSEDVPEFTLLDTLFAYFIMYGFSVLALRSLCFGRDMTDDEIHDIGTFVSDTYFVSNMVDIILDLDD